jgi:hypothetical protein
VDPDLVGNKPEVVQARSVVVQLARECGMSPGDVAWALRLHPRSLWRLARQTVAPRVLRAARMRIALEDEVGRLP